MLRPADRFNVIAFNNVATPMFPRPVAADAASLDEAAEKAVALAAAGGGK